MSPRKTISSEEPRSQPEVAGFGAAARLLARLDEASSIMRSTISAAVVSSLPEDAPGGGSGSRGPEVRVARPAPISHLSPG